MVRPERFELPTYSSGGCRSIQLSYGRVPIFTVYLLRRTLSNRSTTVHVPKALPVVVHAQHAVLGIVPLAASGAGKEAADMRPLLVEIFGNREGSATAARDQEHAGKSFLIPVRLGRSLFH